MLSNFTWITHCEGEIVKRDDGILQMREQF